MFSTWFISSNLRKCYLMIFEESLKTEVTPPGSRMPVQCPWWHLQTAMPYRLGRWEEKLKWPDTPDGALAAGSLPGLGKDSAAGVHGAALMSSNTGGCFLEAGEVHWRGQPWEQWVRGSRIIRCWFNFPPCDDCGWFSQLWRWQLTPHSTMWWCGAALPCKGQRRLLIPVCLWYSWALW